MPWTPFFLKSLLEFDCPIIIGEGASESRQMDNDRSYDGSWELIQLFAKRWKDRVTIHKHDYTLNTQTGNRTNFTRPREQIKQKVWNEADNGEWIIGLSPDNIYFKKDIKKIKTAIKYAEDDHYLLMTGQRVFCFSFTRVITQPVKKLCGGWTTLWPCIWRKNNEYVLMLGDELLKHHASCRHLCLPDIQNNPNGNRNILIRKDIKQFHYKNVKKHSNRVQRFGSERITKTFDTYPLDGKYIKKYDGDHPTILDNHPWRYVIDCRTQKPDFNWKQFTDLVTKP
jgi:hypothetical protein